MKVMKAWTLALGLALSCALAGPAHAVQEVAGVKFDDSTTLAGQQLQLNGAGLRRMMIIKVYAIGLYVPKRDVNSMSIVNQPGPKSVQVVLLRDVDAGRLTDALVGGVEANSSPTELAALRSRLDEMASNLRKTGEVTEGTVVRLDYVPNQGTTVSNNGKVVVRDMPGEDFYRALLRIWLGEHPADKGLKERLLGIAD
ncbi:MAG TPA: chalcone isomerase family protein [Aquabacterium sp.]|nr:chalcone isomerase family protein [Aquabacterium sp.]